MHSKKRILYVCQGAYPWEVRVEKFCDALIDGGYEVTVLCRTNGEEREREDVRGAGVIRVGAGTARWKSLPTSVNPLWRSAIRRAFDEVRPHLIIVREMLLATACADVARGRCGVIMDMAEHYPAAMKSWKKYRHGIMGPLLVHALDLPEIEEGRAVRACDGIITVCDENTERICKAFGYPADDTVVVHNTPRKHAYDNVRQGTSAPPVVFSYQGWITRERGVERLVKAFAHSGDVDTRLLIAGGGESMDEVQGAVRESGAADRIELTGEFDSSRLSSILSSTDIGVLPFDQDEFRHHTIPNKLFDYMASGKPVIVSQCAPLARIVNETGCGIVVDVTDPEQLSLALHRIRRDDVKTMSEHGRTAALQRYHWEQDARHLLGFVATRS